MRFLNYVIGLLVLVSAIQVHADNIHIAAASNLRFVLPELIEEFEQQSEHHISVSYAASGTLTTQIQHGAPFSLFFSAEPRYIQLLINENLTQGTVINYAQSQLALFAAKGSNLIINDGLESLKIALSLGELNKVAIANPQHAPYGQAAKLSLEQAGIWQKIQPYLIVAENASQVMQFSLSTGVDAGFVPYSFIIQPQFSSLGRFIKLDITLQQQAVLLRMTSVVGQLFLDFIQTKSAQNILIENGFLVEVNT
ncbi:MAG: molybdate ABC transporter substrate-binding protein [Piscirickettsiaceae bacterium]|nr:molybdate ABC transporter substrate-binding protein [Piscirickettsiaceae bacterium]